MDEIRFLVFDPGHFHAALVFKELYRDASSDVHAYAPLGTELRGFLQHIEGFNTRYKNPTSWDLQVYAGRNPLGRMLKDCPGNAVVLSGRNRDKIGTIRLCLDAGLHVLADKPWILSLNDLDRLRQALDLADQKGLISLDIMTERHEITTILQRELIQDPEVFGTIEPGSDEGPGVFLASVHSIQKGVAGSPVQRPASFFDVAQEGEGLTNVGTHLVDLVPWILFPGQGIDAGNDLNLNSARRWPTPIPLADFQVVTGLPQFPRFLKRQVHDSVLDCFCNNSVKYRIRGIHVHLDVVWDVRTPSGMDWHHAVFRGSRATVEVRQSRETASAPQLYVRPRDPADIHVLRKAVEQRCRTLENQYRGLKVLKERDELRIWVPDRYRVGHEAHFGEVTRQFQDYVLGRLQLPGWEKPNMLAKYRLTTAGVHLARGGI
jgi:predicted dehydrogenase